MRLGQRLITAALVLASIGVPLLETWQVTLLAAALLAIVFGSPRHDTRRFVAAVAIVIAAVAVKAALPRADLAEAHNAFLLAEPGSALERGIPPAVFDDWRRQFDALYPPDPEPLEQPRSQWRLSGAPKTLYASSSDAIWRSAKYSRQVDRIDFATLGDFRGGFANELQFNFWSGELRRETMPFYVMYELTAEAVGSRLLWQGQVFWEQADGTYREIVHPAPAAREIGGADVGRRVYAAFFPARDAERAFRLEPSVRLLASRLTGVAVTLASVCAVMWLTVRPRWRAYARALVLVAAAYAFTSAFVAVSQGKFLGAPYPPHGGGDDGLSHDALGRSMAMAIARGDVHEALLGGEPVYWSTPGTRYVRMVEKLVFGDTNHLFMLIVVCVPLVIFYLVHHFAGRRWAWAVSAGFIVMLAGNLSFLQYLANAKLGYGEAVAGGLFLLGLAVLLRHQAAWGGRRRHLGAIACAGAVLAGAMFVRPNFAIAVLWLGGAFAWSSWRRGDIAAIGAVASGLACALWMPFHNYYFGGEFVLISGSRGIAIPLGPGAYLTAFVDLLGGRRDSAAATLVGQQLAGWLLNPGYIVRPEILPLARAALAVKLVALLVSCMAAVRIGIPRTAAGAGLRVMALTALCAHLPMLFIFHTHYRYAMLAWDLSLLVLLVVAAGYVGRRRLASPSPRPDSYQTAP